MTTAEAAKILGVTRMTISHWCQRGRIKASVVRAPHGGLAKNGMRWVYDIDPKSVENFVPNVPDDSGPVTDATWERFCEVWDALRIEEQGPRPHRIHQNSLSNLMRGGHVRLKRERGRWVRG